MCFSDLSLHSQTNAFLDHIVIRKNLVQVVKFTKVQKRGAERGAVTFQLVSEVRGLPSKSQKFHKIEGRGLPMAFHNLQNIQKRGAERGAATLRGTLASEGEIKPKNWYKKRYRHS